MNYMDYLDDEEENIVPRKKKFGLLFAQSPGTTPYGSDAIGLQDDLRNEQEQMEIGSAPPAPSLKSGPDTRSTIVNTSEAQRPEKKQSFFNKLFFGESTPSQTDEYGLQKPGSRKLGLLGALFGSLPATIYGASRGLGLTGLGVGLGAAGQRNQQLDDQALKDYQTARALARQTDYQNRTLEQQAANSAATQELAKSNYNLSKKRYEEGVRHNKAMEGVAAQKTITDKPLSAEAAKTLEIANGGLRNVDLLMTKITPKKQGGEGANLILPSIFDRDTAAVIDDLSDLIGRLRSGGAVNAGEEARFRRLVPSALDSYETKVKKLNRMREMFEGISQKLQKPSSTTGGAGIAPAGATGKVMGDDGNWYWTDGQENLGRAN